ncbi:response regulator transcription factor [Faecalibaculum rodentium]|uniref:response regulator transcription factor n=1 Tax=Faecalibaculum rodentium TaxID=1702221 RepID=UPI00258B9ED0|nr:response regulator transcription factor [Faecalibaculum rodentium]
MNILLIEDDAILSDTICQSLKPVRCVQCNSLSGAFNQMEEQWDVILLDLNLPDGSGMQFLQILREISDVPVIIISSRDSNQEIIAGYTAQADDYLVKPFGLDILRAKTDRILFRTHTLRKSGCILVAGKGLLVGDNDRSITLSPTETAILSCLFSRSLSHYSDLIRHIYARTGKEIIVRTLSTRISELKRKLTDSSLAIIGNASSGFSVKRDL